MSDANGQMVRWAAYVEQLFTVDPLRGQLQTGGLQMLGADTSIKETALSIDDVKKDVAKLKKAAGFYNISVELLKAGGEAMVHELHAVLTAVWHSGTIPSAWSSLSGRGKGIVRTAKTTVV